MKPVVFFGSLVLAAAAGAAAVYFLKPSNTGGPGNGAVVCPGSASCPDEARVQTQAYGIAVPKELTRNGRLHLCDGNSNAGGCRSGFVGYAVRMNSGDWRVKKCVAGTWPCSATHDALYCSLKNGDPAPNAGCAARPD